MSQTKAQLISPVGILTASALEVSGIVTASGFVGNLTGTASTATASATAYGLEGSPNLNVGIVTASSFVGDLTGDATGLSGTPNLNVGVVTASSFVGNLTGNASSATNATNATNVAITNNTSTNSTYYVHFGNATSGNDGIEVDSSTLTYNPSTNTLSTGVLSASSNVDVSGNYTQTVQAVGALDINCSTGNYFTKTISSNSIFTFSSVPSSRAYSFTLELTHTSGSVTWPSEVKWPADTTPSLTTGKTHLFVFVTDDGGSRWRGGALVDYTN